MQTEINFETDLDETPIDMVTTIELAAIKRDRERVAALRAELATASYDLQERELAVIQRIEAGACVDGGAVVLHRRRQSISWLTVVAQELGRDAVERVKNTWPIAFWKELQIA